jgi:3D (Asp-Asp-Asp) domain-containing protein
MIKINRRKLLRSWIISIVITATISSMITLAFAKENPIETVDSIQIVEPIEAAKVYFEPPAIEDQEVIIEPIIQSLGEYTLTAYCSCEICCGEWAKNRLDGIVYGAANQKLIPGVSVAASKEFDFGTVIMIDGEEYVVQDRPAEWIIEKYDGKIIDVYFSDHQEAIEFGKQVQEIYLKEGMIENEQ